MRYEYEKEPLTDINDVIQFLKQSPQNPYYDFDTDYTTNSPSYYDYLAKLKPLIQILAERIYDYDKELAKRFEEWDKRIENLPDELKRMFLEWIDDGTLARILSQLLLDDYATKEMLTQFSTYLKNNVDSNRINVLYPPKNYNAFTGTGELEDTENLNILLNDFNNVFIPKGEYKLNGNVNLKTESKLFGEKGTVLDTTRGRIVADKITHFNIETIKFIEEDLSIKDSAIIIKNGSSRATLKDLYFNTVYAPIDIDYSWIIDMSAIRIHNAYIGVRMSPQANAISIRDSVINNCKFRGVDFSNSETLTIDNTAFHNSEVGVFLGHYVTAVNITGCYFEDNIRRNLEINSSETKLATGVTITGNHFRQPIGQTSDNEDIKKLYTSIYLRNTKGLSIVSNNFFGKSLNNHILLHYPALQKYNDDNVIILSNSFEEVENNIALSSKWNNQSNFITGNIKQPYITNISEETPINNSIVRRNNKSVVLSKTDDIENSVITLDKILKSELIENAEITINNLENKTYLLTVSLAKSSKEVTNGLYMVSYISNDLHVYDVISNELIEHNVINNQIKIKSLHLQPVVLTARLIKLH